MKILDLYESLLKTGGLVVTKDGCVSKKFGDKTEPFIIKGKRVVLPTREHLSNPDWEDRVAFHPLSENVLRKESDVLEEFRSAIIAKLNFTIGLLSFNLIQTASSEDAHSKLTPDQMEFLSVLKNASPKGTTLEVFGKILAAMGKGGSQSGFVNMYLKRGGTVNEKRYQRVGVVTFPFYAELLKNEHDVFGVKVTPKDRKTFIGLMEYLFLKIAEKDAYNRGSDSDIAPYLDALMKSVISVAGPINDQITLFANFLEAEGDTKVEDVLINDEWVETFDNLSVMVNEIRSIPMQAGNEGKGLKQEETKQQTQSPIIQQQQQPTGPLPAALMNNGQRQFPQQNKNFMNYGVQQQQHTGIVKTKDGLDFNSILQNNPVLANAVGGVGASPQFQFQAPEPVPSWARGSQNFGNNQQFQQMNTNFGGGFGNSMMTTL